MVSFVEAGLQLGLIALVVLLVPCAYRVWIGPTAADRLQTVDTITTLLIGIIIVLALLEGIGMFIDIAIALAAFAFIGTLALARHISEASSD